MEFEEIVRTINSLKNLIRRELPKPIHGSRPYRGVQPTEENIEDVVQESLLTAWRRMDEFDPEQSSLSTWCGWVVRGECANYKRNEAMIVTGGDFQDSLGGDGPSENHQLDQSIDDLPLMEKTMVELYAAGYTYKDIAAILGSTESSVKSRLAQIKSKWKEKN